MLDEEHTDLPEAINDCNAYKLGSIGEHNVVIACLPGEIGNNAAATVAIQMILTFPSIKFGLLVGIGSGVPPAVRLGDVVVSIPTNGFSGVVQWDFGKAEQGDKFKQIGVLNSPPSALRTALTILVSKHEMEGSRIPEHLDVLKQKYPRLAAKYLRSESLEDVLFWPDHNHVDETSTSDYSIDSEDKLCPLCDRTMAVKRKPREMCVHYGMIASGNQVIKDAAFRDKINKRLGGNVLCFETEAAGLMNDFPCIVIRGICDYADSHKNKNWRQHIAVVAAAFAKELLEVIPPAQVEARSTTAEVIRS
jgi:nucleoside phosphorylase